MSAESETFPHPGTPFRNPPSPPIPVRVSPDIIEEFLYGVPGNITNPVDIGIAGQIREEETKRRQGKEANVRSVAETRTLIADGKRELAKLRAARSAAMSDLMALYGKDGSVTADMFQTVEATPGASGAGVGTAIVLAKREHDRCFEVCEAAKRNLHHWQRCLAEDQERLDSGVFDRPTARRGAFAGGVGRVGGEAGGDQAAVCGAARPRASTSKVPLLNGPA